MPTDYPLHSSDAELASLHHYHHNYPRTSPNLYFAFFA